MFINQIGDCEFFILDQFKQDDEFMNWINSVLFFDYIYKRIFDFWGTRQPGTLFFNWNK